jgi:hypothetical protein
MAREIRPTYPNLTGKKLEACRAKAREGGLAEMSSEERRAYGEAVEKAIRALQLRELMTCRNRIDPAPAAAKYAEAMTAKRAREAARATVVDRTIPADLGIPAFLKRPLSRRLPGAPLGEGAKACGEGP